jgi:hypothetical protein
VGPFEILEKHCSNDVKLNLSLCLQCVLPVQNVQYLLLYALSDASNDFAPTAPKPEIIDREEEYKVKDIITHQYVLTQKTNSDSSDTRVQVFS